MDLSVSIGSPERTAVTDDDLNPPASPEEIELLQKLEAANKLLEQDEKSLKSVSGNSSNPDLVRQHSRKGSNTSLVSSNSVGSHISNLMFDDDSGNSPDESWVVWGKVISDWDNTSKKRPQYIRDLVRKGIPHHFRGIVWQYLCGAHDSEYKDHFAVYLKMVSPCEKVIRRDIARTYPDHDFFREKDGLGQESLFNVMKAYSLHDREVGYCQGSGFIVGLLLMQMPEEEAFAVLVKLMQDYRLRELFKPTMAELGLCFYQLEYMIQENMPNLYLHFQSQSFHTSMYASQWFLTLYTTVLPLPVACRIMDTFISEGIEVIFKVGIALLHDILPDLLCLDMEQMLQYFQKDVPARYVTEDAIERLLQASFNIKYNIRKMKKLEKEYTVLKSKEHVEQVELRRLRSENKLLKHRIDNLEKENVMLADRLIQGQVTRAHEAEDMFIVKRELSTLRTQHSEALEKLEEANDVISTMKSRENSKLRRDPDSEVQGIQDELIAVKLREAEANLSMKELRQRVNELEIYWQKYQERNTSKDSKTPKSQVQLLHDELMSVKLREAETLADLKEMKQKVMEFETQNHICSHQIKRLDEENSSLRQKLEESCEREKILKSEIQQWERRSGDAENRRKEEEVMQKIRAAEHSQVIAEMRQKVAELEIKNQELLTTVQLKADSHTQDLENQIADLEDEVVQLRLSARKKMTFSTLDINKVGLESDSETESEDMDTTLTDNGKFRTLLTSQYCPIVEDHGEIVDDVGELVDEEGIPIVVSAAQGDSNTASTDKLGQVQINVGQGLTNGGQGLSNSGDGCESTSHPTGARIDSQNNVKHDSHNNVKQDSQNDNKRTSKNVNGGGYDAFSDEMERALDNL